MSKSFYDLLGVRQNAHPAEIDLAYKSITEAQKDLDWELQLELSLAHKTLMHPTRREEYDTGMPAVPTPQVMQHQPLPNNIVYMPAPQQQNKVLTYAILGYMIGMAVIALMGAILL
jgi:hypothetical protein